MIRPKPAAAAIWLPSLAFYFATAAAAAAAAVPLSLSYFDVSCHHHHHHHDYHAWWRWWRLRWRRSWSADDFVAALADSHAVHHFLVRQRCFTEQDDGAGGDGTDGSEEAAED